MRILPIEKFAEVITGGTPSTQIKEYWNGNIPWLNSGELNRGIINSASNFITDAGLKNSATKMMPINTVLIALTGATTGVTALLNIEACANQSVTGILPSPNHIPKYLYYFLRSIRDKILNESYGGAQKHISQGYVKKILVPLPSLEEQKRIVQALAAADALRQKRKQSIALLDDYLKSVFLEMFGDPVENPKGWKIVPLARILRNPTQNGLYVPKEKYSNNGVEMVHMSDVFYGIVSRGTLKKVNISNNDIKKYTITADDLLIARRSLTYEGAAKPCRIGVSDKPLVFESSLIKVSVDQKKVLPLYLYFYFSNERARNNYLLKHVTSSTISGINQAGLNKVEIIVPPIELQNTFAKIVLKIEQLKRAMAKQSTVFETNFNVLMQSFFS